MAPTENYTIYVSISTDQTQDVEGDISSHVSNEATMCFHFCIIIMLRKNCQGFIIKTINGTCDMLSLPNHSRHMTGSDLYKMIVA